MVEAGVSDGAGLECVGTHQLHPQGDGVSVSGTAGLEGHWGNAHHRGGEWNGSLFMGAHIADGSYTCLNLTH